MAAIGSLLADNRTASYQGLEPHHAYWGPDQSVWYRWKAPSTGTYRFTSSTTGRTRSWRSIRGTLDTLVPLADTELTTVRIGAVAGTTYWIAVDSFGGGGPFALSWTSVSAPANDNQASATLLSGAGGQVDGTTVGASRQAGEPQYAARRGSALSGTATSRWDRGRSRSTLRAAP